MKRKILTITLCMIMCIATTLTLGGCQTQADKVSYNISLEADNFNVVRQLTVVNCIKGDVIFQMTGRFSIKADTAENQLEVTVEDENKRYQKHFIGLSDNVTYVVEDIRASDVSNYKYTLNFNPNMWLPVDIKTID